MAYPGIDNSPIQRVVQVDPSGNPIYASGVLTTLSSTTQVLAGTGTVVTPLFHVTGSIQVTALYAIVTADLGPNQTAAFWRLNDQSAQPPISLATGTAISAAKAGSLLARISLVGVALSLKNASAGGVLDVNSNSAPDNFMPFALTQKTGGVQTDIEFVFTTTDNPTSGTIQHFVRWRPLSVDGNLTVI